MEDCSLRAKKTMKCLEKKHKNCVQKFAFLKIISPRYLFNDQSDERA